MFLFAEVDPISQFFTNVIVGGLMILCIINIVLKRVDKDGVVKRTTGKVAFRSGLKLFDIVRKW